MRTAPEYWAQVNGERGSYHCGCVSPATTSARYDPSVVVIVSVPVPAYHEAEFVSSQ